MITLNPLELIIVDEAPPKMFIHHLLQPANKNKAAEIIAYCIESVPSRHQLLQDNNHHEQLQEFFKVIALHKSASETLSDAAYDLLLKDNLPSVFLEAAAYGHTRMCQKVFADANNSVDVPRALLYAVSGGHLELTQWLVDHGGALHHQHLEQAIKMADIKTASFIYSALPSSQRWAALSYSIGWNSEDMLQHFWPLLQQQVHTTDDQEKYQSQLNHSLSLAVSHQNMNWLKKLLEEGADPQHENNEALMMAVSVDNVKMVELLYPLSANIEQVYEQINEDIPDAWEDEAGILFLALYKSQQEYTILNQKVSGSDKVQSKKKI